MTSVARPTAVASDSAFVARQPIFDRRRQVVAYELLCRPSFEATSCLLPSEQASARVMVNALTAFGLALLTKGHPAFINVTRHLLLDGAPRALPPKSVVIELLEDIEADDDVLRACRELRTAGYSIALDDFVLTDRNAALIDVADYIKVDFLASPRQERDRLARYLEGRSVKLLAEKVETGAVFEQALQEGYQYFQGFFFGRPMTQRTRAIPARHLATLRLLQAFNNHELSIDELEECVKQDATVSLRVLRAVNSAGFAVRSEVKTMREALLLLGRDTIRHWASVLVLAQVAEVGSDTLVGWAIVRARFCELIGIESGADRMRDSGFLLGLCSLLDALLGCSMSDAVADLPIEPEMKAALLGEASTLRPLLECALAYERAEWLRSLEVAAQLGIDGARLPRLYGDALRWAERFGR